MTKEDIVAIDKYLAAAANGNLYIDYISEAAKKAKLVLDAELSENLADGDVFKKWLYEAIEEKNDDKLEKLFIMAIIYEQYDEKTIEILGTIACDDWHKQAENLLDIFEHHPTSLTCEILCKMAHSMYPGQNYGRENNENITKKVVWALWRLKEHNAVKMLSECDDEIAAKYAVRQMNVFNRK